MHTLIAIPAIISLAIATTVALSSDTWMYAWIALELSSLAIIPIMLKEFFPRPTEAAIKYFLIQGAAASILLFATVMNVWMTGEWSLNKCSPACALIILVSLAMKLGIAPFHFWMPDVLQGLTLQTGLILATWQKIAPMGLLIQLSPSLDSRLMMILGSFSILIGGWGGANQTQIRKILAYSSIAHLGWTTIIITHSQLLATLNFIFYILVSATLFLTLVRINVKNMTGMSTYWSNAPILTAFSLFTLLSLSGLPPLTGFAPKWLIVQELAKQDSILFALGVLFSTFLSLFFYIRLAYYLALLISPHLSISSVPWVPSKKSYLAPLITLSLFLLPMGPLIWSLFSPLITPVANSI